MHKADALEKLKRKYAEAGKTKEKLQAEIDALDQEEKQLQEDAERAASRQDLYTALKALDYSIEHGAGEVTERQRDELLQDLEIAD